MVDSFRGKIERDSIGEIIRSRDRKRAGRCAPGEGLYLLGVDYPGFSFRGELPFILDLRGNID
jgi:tRNA U38,U39,U40 pseudouridine synthase TruA